MFRWIVYVWIWRKFFSFLILFISILVFHCRTPFHKRFWPRFLKIPLWYNNATASFLLGVKERRLELMFSCDGRQAFNTKWETSSVRDYERWTKKTRHNRCSTLLLMFFFQISSYITNQVRSKISSRLHVMVSGIAKIVFGTIHSFSVAYGD